MQTKNGRMEADQNLINDINKTTNYDDLKALLENAAARSGIAARDPQTGRFVTAEESAQTTQSGTTQQTTQEPREFKKTVQIAGQEFEFTSDSAEGLETQIASAQSVAAELLKSHAEEENASTETARQAELRLKYLRGEISPAEFLEQGTGQSLDAIARTVADHENAEYTQSWSDAVQSFLAQSDWPGGDKNKNILQMTLSKMGLEDADDKVAALNAAYDDMKRNGLVLAPQNNDAAVLKEVEKLSPQEIMELYKSGHANKSADELNDAFVRSYSSSGSGIFGK